MLSFFCLLSVRFMNSLIASYVIMPILFVVVHKDRCTVFCVQRCIVLHMYKGELSCTITTALIRYFTCMPGFDDTFSPGNDDTVRFTRSEPLRVFLLLVFF